MAVDKAGKRIEVLLEWRDLVVAAGHAVPTVADMMRIGASGEVRPDGVDLDAVEPWADTISHLLRQLKYGVPAPVSQIPDDLMEPSAATARSSGSRAQSAPGPTSTPPTAIIGSRPGDDPVLVALRAWWQAEQKSDPALRSLKEHHLRSIITTGSRTEAEIRRHLPAPLANHARRISEVITDAIAPTPASPAPPAGSGSAPAGTPRHSADPPTRPRPSTVPRPATSTGSRPTHTAPPVSTRPPGAPGRTGPGTEPARGDAEAADDGTAGLELADYEFGDELSGAEPREAARIRSRLGPDGLVLTWPKADVTAESVLYRVVSSDRTYAPERPQVADLLRVTESVRCVDARPFRYAVRHVQVWVHAGRTREEAAAAEPTKHAECVVVAHVTEARINEDGRSVVGKWRVPPGVQQVDVLRVPWEHARPDGHSDSGDRLSSTTTGFVDDRAERGRRFVYELSVVVDLGNRQVVSDPTKIEVTVSAELRPVRDLVHDETRDLSVLDLEWTTPPGGEVRIYRTQNPPAAGLDEGPQPVSVLDGAGLTAAGEVNRPIVNRGGRSSMADVSWPVGWTFAYLTPVTIMGDTAAVGPSKLVTRVGAILEPRIVERTQRQILTFAWPRGADAVLAYRGGPNQSADDARRTGRPEEISHKQYVANGGMYFRERLPPRGCSVHLEPVVYSGHRTTGPIVTLIYPGLLQFGYRVHVERDKAQKVVSVRLQIFAETDQGRCPWFTLVYRHERLPLHERDGAPLPMRAYHDQQPKEGPQFRPSTLGPDPGDVHWYSQVNGLAGYLRLFVCQPTEGGPPVALFDPPIEQLYIAPPRAGS